MNKANSKVAFFIVFILLGFSILIGNIVANVQPKQKSCVDTCKVDTTKEVDTIYKDTLKTK